MKPGCYKCADYCHCLATMIYQCEFANSGTGQNYYTKRELAQRDRDTNRMHLLTSVCNSERGDGS